MIYFIEDTITHAVKIGYSKNPDKRMAHLQTATPNLLKMLGKFQGGLEHESAYHERFAKHHLQGEWFSKEILPAVLDIIAKEAASSQKLRTNVIIFGESDNAFPCLWSDGRTLSNPEKLETVVSQALTEIHATTPIAWVITGGGRRVDQFAHAWAYHNKVEVHYFSPKWSKYGRFAAFKIGPQMLRSMFDPKTLLVIQSNNPSATTKDMIRRAGKMGIPVVTKECS